MSEHASQRPGMSAPRATEPAPRATTTPAPSEPKVDRLPPFKVLLHNDDHNDMVYVVETLMELTPLEPQHAAQVMLEAHKSGVALVLVTHRERAELYHDQFQSKGIKVTIEAAE